MTVQFILVLVYILSGKVVMDVTGHADGYACNESAESLVQSGTAAGRVMLSATCYPVSKAWGLVL